MNTPAANGYNVVAAFDFSALGERAVEEAFMLCSGKEHAQVHVIAVGWAEFGGLRLPSIDALLTEEEAQKAVGERVGAIVKQMEQSGRPVNIEKVPVYVADGEAAERICALATSIDADLIVLGTHGRKGLARWVLGSVAEQVVRNSPCGVWVMRPRDFLNGEHLPEVEPPLKPGEHSLKPFSHRPTYHYVRRGDRSSGSFMPVP